MGIKTSPEQALASQLEDLPKRSLELLRKNTPVELYLEIALPTAVFHTSC